MFDIVGDVHGHAEALRSLLRKLGYRRTRGAFRYPRNERTAIFLGDFIDRGPDSPGVVRIAREMVDAGTAIAVTGNHEFNAIAYHTRDARGRWLRSHTPAHTYQHSATIAQYRAIPERWKSDLAWMRALPLYLETAGVRVVHAVWDPAYVDGADGAALLMDDSDLEKAARPGTPAHRQVETLLKGVEVDLPRGVTYRDKEGFRRRRTRIRWWLPPGIITQNGITWRELAMPPVESLPDTVPPSEYDRKLIGYDQKKPLFVGHYWLKPPAIPFTPVIACLDYSVAAGGVLTAYRYDGETRIDSSKFVSVPAAGRSDP